MLLYEISIIGAKLFGKKRAEADVKKAQESPG
jgi:Sec-independent protein secretion pathway component TatC